MGGVALMVYVVVVWGAYYVGWDGTVCEAFLIVNG